MWTGLTVNNPPNFPLNLLILIRYTLRARRDQMIDAHKSIATGIVWNVDAKYI